MKADNPIRIVIMGEYSIFRLALRMLIETDANLKVVAEVSKISEVSNLSNSQTPDLILVDLPEEGENSELFQILSEYVDKTPILILASSNNIKIYQECLRSGFNGLVLKEKSAEILFKAIDKVYKGEYWFERSTMRQTIRDLVNEKQVLFENPRSVAHTILSEREKQVVTLVCKGLKNKDIADILFITETTIRHHLSSIFEKLNLKSRLELVIYSFKNNFVELPTIVKNDKWDIKDLSRPSNLGL